MDGFELAQILKSDASVSGTFLIALSGYIATEDRLRAQKAGFDQHLAKPVDMHRLEQVLAGVRGGA